MSFNDGNRNYNLLARRTQYRTYFNKKLNKYMTKTEKWYQYHCLTCGWDNGWINEIDITKGVGCGCCRGFKIVKGINDFGTRHPKKLKYFIDPEEAFTHSVHSGEIAHLHCPVCGWLKDVKFNNFARYDFICERCNALPNTRPDVVDFFIDKNDAWNYTVGSHDVVKLKCKHCGYPKTMTVHSLCSDGFCCPMCSDGISYPEKFMLSLLDQLGIRYIYQLNKKHFKWCGKYRYDFYLPDFNYIIEVHGAQHYEAENQFGDTTLQEVQDNDRHKKDVAMQNHISRYIEIEAKRSRLAYFQKQIIKSLGHFFNLDNVNWIECNQDATKSIVKEVCEYYNSHSNIKIDDMCNIFNLSSSTLRAYLHIGNDNGWCNYIPYSIIHLKCIN